MKITYDSTTHTSGLHMGRYISIGGKSIDFPRNFDQKIYRQMFEEIDNLFGLDCDLERYHAYTNNGLKVIESKYGKTGTLEQVIVNLKTTLTSIVNFMRSVDDISNKDLLLSYVDKKDYVIYNSLYDIKNLEDFNKWEKDFSRYVPSHSVNSLPPANLSGFF